MYYKIGLKPNLTSVSTMKPNPEDGDLGANFAKQTGFQGYRMLNFVTITG